MFIHMLPLEIAFGEKTRSHNAYLLEEFEFHIGSVHAGRRWEFNASNICILSFYFIIVAEYFVFEKAENYGIYEILLNQGFYYFWLPKLCAFNHL